MIRRRTFRFPAAASCATALALAACAAPTASPPPAPVPPKPSATDIPAVRATAEYWYDQPASASVSDADFDRLWNASARAARDFQFTIDRTDFRSGLLTTVPMISKQWFEPWRRDAGTATDVVRSSLQTIRRSIHLQISRAGGDAQAGYIVEPKVLVEELSIPERRLTSVSEYRRAFSPTDPTPPDDSNTNPNVTPQANWHWFAIGRDAAMENQLAQAIRHHLQTP